MARSRRLPQASAAEVEREREEHAQVARMEQLQALGKLLADSRKEAIDGRAASGIEAEWIEDEEFIEGIDDLNRHERGGKRETKPPYQATPDADEQQSTIFPNITRPYVEAAAAKVGDILLPTDDRPWSLKPTPVPELQAKAKGKLPLEVIEGMAQVGASEEQAVQVAQAEQEAADALLKEAEEKAKKAEKRIEDWHIECQWHAEARLVIDDECRVGTGVLKGPMPVKKKVTKYIDGEIVIERERKPVSKRVSYWNCFPDPACGENIHNGRFHWERDFITAKQLLALRDQEGYLADQIELCYQEGPAKKTDAARKQADGREIDDKAVFEIWYFYGFATREQLALVNAAAPEGKALMVPATFTMVNSRVIKGDLNHLDTGEFPYDYAVWQPRKNLPWGMGVARQIRPAQQIVTAATRTMLTNAGRAAGPIFVIGAGTKGANGNNDIIPWKKFFGAKNDAGEPVDAREAMNMLEVPDRQASLMAIIQYGMKLAEDVTGLPLLLQGQAGNAPETLGGQMLVDRNASGVLRRIARMFDDRLTEPHIRRYYTYLLQYGPDDEKGEYMLDARGSTALVERELERQYNDSILQASLNPAFEISPAKAMEQKLRTDKRNPKDFQYTEEEKAKMAEQQAQQGQQGDPRAEASKEVANIRANAEKEKAAAQAAAEQAEREWKAAEAEKEREHQRHMAELDNQRRVMEFAEKRNVSIEQIKAELAGTVIKVKAQERLSRDRNAKGPQLSKPPTEPAGRAPNGQAYQK
jgi:hypothetical protein